MHTTQSLCLLLCSQDAHPANELNIIRSGDRKRRAVHPRTQADIKDHHGHLLGVLLGGETSEVLPVSSKPFA